MNETCVRRRLVRRLVVLVIMAWALTAPAYAQTTAVIAGGPHDLSNGSAVRNANATIDGQTCIFCHTPHGGSNNIPLWNRTTPTGAAYQLYTSSTSAVTTTAAQVAASVSGACLSCHDGTIAMDVLVDVNGLAGPSVTFNRQAATAKAAYAGAGGNTMSGGLPFLGSDLRNDHPVAIVYETARAAAATEFVAQVVNGQRITVGAVDPVPIYGSNGATATVECASCHNAHNNSMGNFLRKANTGSSMCLSCHIK